MSNGAEICDGASIPIAYVTNPIESSKNMDSNVPPCVDAQSQTIEITYGNKTFTCNTCNKSGNGTRFQEHLMKHLLLKPYKCLHCLQCFSGRSEIGGHMHKKHPGKEKKSALRANKHATVILSEAKKKGYFSFKSNFVSELSKAKLENGVPSPASVLSSNANTDKFSGSKVENNIPLSKTVCEKLPLLEIEQTAVGGLPSTQPESHLLTEEDTLTSRNIGNKTETETSSAVQTEEPETISMVPHETSDLLLMDKTKNLNKKSEAISVLHTENDVPQASTESENMVRKDTDVFSPSTELEKSALSKSECLQMLEPDKDSPSLKTNANKDFIDETTLITNKNLLEQSTFVLDFHNDHTYKSNTTQSIEQFSYQCTDNQKQDCNTKQTIEASECGHLASSKSGDVDHINNTVVVDKADKIHKNNKTSNQCQKCVTEDNVSKKLVHHECKQDVTDKVTTCQDTVVSEQSLKSDNLHEEAQIDQDLVTNSCGFKVSKEFKEKLSQAIKNTSSESDPQSKSSSVENTMSNKRFPSNLSNSNVYFEESKLTENCNESQTLPISTGNNNIDNLQILNTSPKPTMNGTSEKVQNSECPEQNIATKPLFSFPTVTLLDGSNIQHQSIASTVQQSQEIVKFVQPNIIVPPVVLANNISVCAVNTATSLPPVTVINSPTQMRSYFIVPISLPPTITLAPGANIQQNAFPVTAQGSIGIQTVFPQKQISPNFKPTSNYTQRIVIKHKMPSKGGVTNADTEIPQSKPNQQDTQMNMLSPVNILPLSVLDATNKHSLKIGCSSPIRSTKISESCQPKEKPEAENSFVSEDFEEKVDGILFKETAGEEKKRSNIFIAIVGHEYLCGKCRLKWKKKESFWFHLWNHQHIGGILCDKCVRTNGPAGELTCSWTDSFIEQLEQMKVTNNPENMPFNVVKARVTQVVGTQKEKPSVELDDTTSLPADENQTSHSADENKTNLSDEESKSSQPDKEKDSSKDSSDDGANEMGLIISECKSLDIKEFDGINSAEECPSRSVSELQSNQNELEQQIDEESVFLKKIAPVCDDLSDSDNTNQDKSETCIKNNASIDALISEVQKQNLPSETMISCEDKEIENYFVHVQNKENGMEKTFNDSDKLKDSYPLEDFSSDNFSHIQAPAYHFYVCGGMCSFSGLLPGDFKQHLLKCKYIQEGSFTCFHCGYVGESVEILMRHVHKHAACHKNVSAKPPSAVFQCSIPNCKFSTNILNAFYGHCCQVHVNLSSYTCASCEQVYPTAQDLAQHLKENLLSVVNCRHCLAKDVDKKIVMEHILFEHPGKGKMLNTVKQLLCKERKMYGYYACQSQFNMIDTTISVTNFTKQTTTASIDPSVHEPVCGSIVQKTSQKPKIDETKKSSLNSLGDSFCCSICSYVASDSNKLSEHLSCHAGPHCEDDMLCFVCPACPMQVNTMKEFENHAECHAENVSFWLYKCFKDNYQTNQGTMMLRHIRKENHPCESEVDLLQAEEKYVTSKVIKCTCCKFKTTRVACLDEHMKGHTIITSKAPAVRVAAHSTTDVDTSFESTPVDDSHLQKQKAGPRKKRVRSHSKDESRPVKKNATKRRFNSDADNSRIPKSMEDEIIFTVPNNSVFRTDVACPECNYKAFFKINLLKHIKENHPMVVVKESEILTVSKSNKYLSGSKMSSENCNFVEDSEPDSNKLDDMKIGSLVLDAELASFYKTSDNLLVCKMCEKVCAKKKLVHHHILDHLKLNLWKCTSCDFQDNRRFIIINHAKNVHGTDCGVAPVKDFLKKLHEHKDQKKNTQKQVHETQILDSPLISAEMNEKLKVLYKNEDWCFECLACKMKYNSVISIHKHVLQIHLKIALFGCSLCWFEGLEEHEVLEHMSDKHLGKPANVLHLNVEIGASVKRFIESSPKSLFIKKKKLMLGNDDMDSFLNCLYEVNRRMKLVCLICKDELSTKYSAHRHLLAHLGVDLVGCSSCEFKALSDRDVIEHMKSSHAGIQLKIDYLDVDIAEAVKDFFDRSCKISSKEHISKEGMQKRQTVEKSKATSSTSKVGKPLKVSSSPDMGCKKDVKKKIVGGLTKYKCRFCEYLALSVRSVRAHIFKSHPKKEGTLFKCSKCSFQVESLVEISNHMFEKHPWVLGDGFEAINSNISSNSMIDTVDVANTRSKADASKMLEKGSPPHKPVQETVSVSSTKEPFLSDVSIGGNQETEKQIVPKDSVICSSAEKSANQSDLEAEKYIDVQVNHASSNVSDDCTHRSNDDSQHKNQTIMCSMDKEVSFSLQLRVSSNHDTDTKNKDESNEKHQTSDPCLYSDISDDEITDSVKVCNENTNITLGLVVGGDKSIISDPCMYDEISYDETSDSLKKRNKRKINFKSKTYSDRVHKRKKLAAMVDSNDNIHADPNLVAKEKNKQKVRDSKTEGICTENAIPQKASFDAGTTTIKKELDTVFQCSKCLFTTKNEEKSFASHLRVKHGILKYVQCGYCSARYVDTKTVERHMQFFHKDRCNSYQLLPLRLLFKEVKHEMIKTSVDKASGDQNESISSESRASEMVPLKIESKKGTKPKENTNTLIKKLKDSASSSKVKDPNNTDKEKYSHQKILGKTKKTHTITKMDEPKNSTDVVNRSVDRELGARSYTKTNDKSTKKKDCKNIFRKKDSQVSKQEDKKSKKSPGSVKEKFIAGQHGKVSKEVKKCKKSPGKVEEEITCTSSQDGHLSKEECKKGKKSTIEKDKKIKTTDEVHIKYRCKYCSFEDSDTAKTRQHLYDHWHYKPYKCSFCLQGFTCSEKRALHAKEAHENIITFCRLKRNEETEICANKMLKVFEQIAKCELAKHKKALNVTIGDQEDTKNEKHHSKGKQKLTDNKCTKQLSKKSKAYLNTGDGANFKCYHCNKSTFNLESLRIHFGKKHSEVKKKSRFWIDLKTSQLCSMSGAVFEDRDKTVTYSQCFLCGYCSMRSSKRSCVSQHQHFCHSTKMGFIVNLNNVVGAHDNSISASSCSSTPDHCAEPVAKKLKFTSTQSPKKSEAAESNPKTSSRQSPIQYCCNQCPYKEISLYYYRRHLASHGTFCYLSSDMSQTCALKCGCCGYVASDSSDFSSHVSTHFTGERTYKCGYCSYDSFKRCGVQSHLESAHSGKKVKILDLQKAQAAAVAKSTKTLVNVDPVVRIKDIMGVPPAEFGDLLLEHGVSTIDLSYIEDDKILQILKLFGSAIPDDQLYELLNE